MNIYIHYYMYFIFNSRPAINNLILIITPELSTADDKIWWQALLMTYAILLQIPSSANESLIISMLRNSSVRFCWWNVDYQPVIQTCPNRLLLTCSFDLYIDMARLSTIECTYLMRALCLKYFHDILPYSTTPCRDGLKANGAWLQKIGNSGTSALPPLALGTAWIHSITYIERRYEEDIPMAYL